MPTGYGIGPTPRLQFTLNNGQWNAFGTLTTLDFFTGQPKPTYSQPGGMAANPTSIPLDEIGRTNVVFWEDTSAYLLRLNDRFGNLVWQLAVPYFPLSGGGGGGNTIVLSEDNLIINGEFRFFPIVGYAPIPDTIDVLAEGGWSFEKNGTNATDSLTFKKFTPDNTAVDASPVYYLNYVSTGAASDETIKDAKFRISDVRTLANESITVGINVRSALAGSYTVSVYIRQNFGSGGSGFVETLVGTFMPTSSAQPFHGTITIPSLAGKTVGINGDDHIEIRVRFPLNTAANIELTNVYFKRGAAATDYPYITSDQTNAMIKSLNLPNHARVTDFTEAVGTQSPEQAYNALMLLPGADNTLSQAWLPTIPIGATVDWFTETLPAGGWIGYEGQALLKAGQYRRLYNVLGLRYGKPLDNLSVEATEANSFIIVTDMKGTVVPTDAGTTSFTIERLTESYDSGVSFVTFNMAMDTPEFQNDMVGAFSPVASAGTSGMTVTIISNGTPTTQANWTIAALPASGLTHSTYFEYDSDEGLFYRYFIIDGMGADPVVPGRIGAPIRLEGSNTNVEVAKRIAYAVQGKETTRVSPTVAGLIAGSDHWDFGIVSQDYYNWFTMDGVGIDPMVVGKIGVRTDLFSTFSLTNIIDAIIDSINPLLWLLPDTRGEFIRYWDHGRGLDPDAATRMARPDGVSGDHVGTTQEDEFKSHTHPGYTDPPNLTHGAGTAANIPSPGGMTGATGGAETRPGNIYAFKIGKY